MMAICILIFGIVSSAFSFMVIRKFEKFEKTELMSYMLLFIWGAFLFGIYLSRLTDKVLLVSLLR